MSYKVTLKEFDENISNYVNQLKFNLVDIRFDTEEGIRFINSFEVESEKIFAHKKEQGIYLFELNLDSENLVGEKKATRITNFAKSWAKKKNDSFFSSSVIKKRLKCRTDFNEQWLPIYIGKNKDIYKRIIEHVELSPKKNTYAMKLKHRTNLHGLEFRVSTIEINVENYDFIVPHIERSLREIYNPLIGKQ